MRTYPQALQSILLVYIAICLGPVPCCPAHSSSVVLFEIRNCGTSAIFFILMSTLVILILLYLHINYWIPLPAHSSPMKNVIGILVELASNVQLPLVNLVIFSILVLPLQEHGSSFHHLALFLIHIFTVLKHSL